MDEIMEALFHCDLPYSQSQDFEKRYSVALENMTQAERRYERSYRRNIRR